MDALWNASTQALIIDRRWSLPLAELGVEAKEDGVSTIRPELRAVRFQQYSVPKRGEIQSAAYIYRHSRIYPEYSPRGSGSSDP